MAMGGSEAIVESYYSVMNSQRKDGGQDNEALDMRTLIDWSLLPVIKCPETVRSIAKIYRSGNAKANISRHRTPIFADKQGRTHGKYKVSKVVDNQLYSTKGLPFFN